jgi:hypothetical protein
MKHYQSRDIQHLFVPLSTFSVLLLSFQDFDYRLYLKTGFTEDINQLFVSVAIAIFAASLSPLAESLDSSAVIKIRLHVSNQQHM